MTNIVNSSAEPSYIARLALNASPFNSSLPLNSYFHGEQAEQRLNLIFHLVRASDKVACLFAEKGVGKSSLLAELQNKSGDDLRFCYINGDSSTLDSKNFIALCLQAFGVDDAEIVQSSNSHELLRGRLERLRKLNIRPVLIVDNLDKAPEEVLLLLTSFLEWQEEQGFLLQAIVTASTIIPEWQLFHGRTQRVDLPNLSEKELPLYLMHRLIAVGYKGEMPFSDKQVKQFYRQSQGCPAQVNQLAHQALLGIKLQASNATLNFTKVLAYMKWVGLAVLALSLILLLVFQDRVNELLTNPDNDTSRLINETTEVIRAEKPLASVVADDVPISAEEQAQREELVSLIETLSDDKPIIEPAVEVEEVISTPPVASPANKPSVITLAISEQRQWIEKQNSTHYTYQLMGSWEHAEVTEFIDKYGLSGDVAEFQSMRNERVWYALIYGVYESKQQALKASKQWPAPLNTLPSWLRRFDSVQKQLKSMDVKE